MVCPFEGGRSQITFSLTMMLPKLQNKHHKTSKFLDGYVCTNNGDPRMSLIKVSTLFAIPSASFGCKTAL